MKCAVDQKCWLLSKRSLQVIIVLSAFIPVVAGLSGIIMGPAMISGSLNASIPFDSHYRYLSGLLLGIGLSFWTTVPNLEHKGKQFRLLTVLVVIGGLGRATAIFAAGAPDQVMCAALVMELVVTPLLAFQQYRLSAACPAKL